MNRKPRISYYAHHMGSGHLRHAQRLAATGLAELQVASTGTASRKLFADNVQYVPLEADEGSSQLHFAPISGHLHYAPTGKPIVERFAALNAGWKAFGPDLVMVDVSVEVALFARLSGYRVALRRMPGVRTDRPHRMAYDLADALFAYYPQHLEEPLHRDSYAQKSYYLGTPAPHAARPVATRASDRAPAQDCEGTRRVVVQTSLAASVDSSRLVEAAVRSPSWSWEVIGSVHGATDRLPENLRLHGTVEHPEQWLDAADVVISSSGHNAVAAAAASKRPTMLIPEERPHAEQAVFARMLHEAGGCAMLESWDEPVDWEGTLAKVAGRDGSALARTLLVSQDEFTAGVRRMFSSLCES